MKKDKIKIIRVVTNPTVVPWHLRNTLNRHMHDEAFEVYVVGDDLEQFNGSYGKVQFINWSVQRKPSIMNDFVSLLSLINIIKELSPDIVHSVMPKSGLLASIASFICRVPIRVHTFTGQMWNLKENCRLSYLYWLDRLVLKLNTHCFTDSPSQSEYLFEHGFSTPERTFIPYLCNGSLSGVDLSAKNTSIRTRDCYNLKKNMGLDNSFVFIYLARKDVEKGAFETLEIFHKYRQMESKDVKLLFIGPDFSNGKLAMYKIERPELFTDVIELGIIDNPAEYLMISDVLLLPSFREGFGSIVIDASLNGIPTIGTNIVGLRDAIEDGQSGFLFEVHDHSSAICYMSKLVNDEGFYIEMSSFARERAIEKFNADDIHNELSSFYLKTYKETML